MSPIGGDTTSAVTPDVVDRVVIAVDGGGSKTDVVALSLDGQLVARLRGVGSNPQALGLAPAIRIIGHLVERMLESISDRPVERVCIYLAGLDLPAEIEAFTAALAVEAWSMPPGSRPPIADNDLFALLRTGTNEPNAVAVICGTGINALGVRTDGATARFPSLGVISGDWGGGAFLGSEALWHAARSEDGRGAKTSLETLVPEAFGLSSVAAVAQAFHFDRIPGQEISSLCPVLFAAARAGDVVATSIVDHQAEEIVLMASAAIRRLDLLDMEVPVVLGGGVLGSNDARLTTAIRDGLAASAPRASMHLLTAPPILGAGLLALESVGATPASLKRARDNMINPVDEAMTNAPQGVLEQDPTIVLTRDSGPAAS